MEISKEQELLAANLILPIIKDIVGPKIDKIFKKNDNIPISKKQFEYDIEKYMQSKYRKHLIIDTLAFPNKQTLFIDLYEPLTVIADFDSGKRVEIKIDGYAKGLIPKFGRIVIEDTAGMGKSTIIKKIFMSIIEEKVGIPILIQLRQINEENTFINEIQRQLSPLGKLLDVDIILKIIEDGEFIMLFDGLDEISRINKEFVVNSLHDFIEKANLDHCLITSRAEDTLASFGDFHKFNVKPLSKHQAYNLIRRYDHYSYKPIAELLINKLNDNNNKSLMEFIENPFLVSLMFKSFEYKKDIPLKRSQFYAQVYDALYEAHDLSKDKVLVRDKYSNLHSDDFNRVLRYIAYITSVENEVEYTKDYLLSIINKAKKFAYDLNFKASDYLKDLLETVPLFKRDGGYIKWAHKSIQDCFAARFIWLDSKDSQKDILIKIFNDTDNVRFMNVLELLYEMNPSLFEESILLWTLEKYENHYNVLKKSLSKIGEKSIKLRAETSFALYYRIVFADKDRVMKIGKPAKGLSAFHGDYIREFVGIGPGSSWSYSYIENFENKLDMGFGFVEQQKNIHTVLVLLGNKKSDLIRDNGNRDNKYSLPLGIDTDVLYEFNNDSQNSINRVDVFDFFSSMINIDYCLNHDKVLAKLKELRRVKSGQSENDLLGW